MGAGEGVGLNIDEIKIISVVCNVSVEEAESVAVVHRSVMQLMFGRVQNLSKLATLE
jgi:hypothetical protein